MSILEQYNLQESKKSNTIDKIWITKFFNFDKSSFFYKIISVFMNSDNIMDWDMFFQFFSILNSIKYRKLLEST